MPLHVLEDTRTRNPRKTLVEKNGPRSIVERAQDAHEDSSEARLQFCSFLLMFIEHDKP